MARDQVLLGIDVGTSSVKVVCAEPDGRVVSRASSEYQPTHPEPQRAEQDPEDWWQAIVVAVRRAVRDAGLASGQVAALCLSTQGGTLVPVDAAGRPTRPAILWTDTRCAPQRAEVADRLGEAAVHDLTGWHLGNGLNLLQSLWLRAHDAQAFRATRQLLSVPDHLVHRLTGRAVLDVSSGGVNQFADYRSGRWAEPFLEVAGIDESRLGTLEPAGSVVGGLLPAAAADLGLPAGTLVVNGGHDQYCVALGTGAVHPGDTFIGSGTAWVVARIGTEPLEDPARRFCHSRHVVPGRFGALTSLESGGAALEWWRRLITSQSPAPSWSEVDARITQRPDQIPLFLPFLHGRTYPEVAPDARGTLWGIEAGHDAYDVAAAVMAGVVFQTAWALDGFRMGPSAGPIVLAGGAAHSAVWTQILTDVVGAPVRVAAEPDAGALGAALLAGPAAGMDPPTVDRPGRIFTPGPDAPAWQARHAQYRRLVSELVHVDSTLTGAAL